MNIDAEECDWCDEKFDTLEELKSHVNEKHAEIRTTVDDLIGEDVLEVDMIDDEEDEDDLRLDDDDTEFELIGLEDVIKVEPMDELIEEVSFYV